MTKTLVGTSRMGGTLLAVVLAIACGDSSSGEGGGGSAGGEATTTSTSTKATTGTGTGTTTSSTTNTAATTASTSASTTGAGGGAGHCADAVRCDGVQGYFCYEVSGPDAAFETACAEELFGTFGQGPCGPTYDASACLFDCVEPSVYSFGVEIEQAQCEGDGGTWVDNP